MHGARFWRGIGRIRGMAHRSLILPARSPCGDHWLDGPVEWKNGPLKIWIGASRCARGSTASNSDLGVIDNPKIGHQAIGANTHPANSERFVDDALKRQDILGLLEQRPSSDRAVEDVKNHPARHFSFWSTQGRVSYHNSLNYPNLVAVTFSSPPFLPLANAAPTPLW